MATVPRNPGIGAQAVAAAEVDLAVRWLGGTVLAASDESFGEKEHLLNADPPRFEPGHYGPRGELVDGWETRRRRTAGHDWALVALGAPGRITSVDVDTSYFTGNHPDQCAVQACGLEGYPGPAELANPATAWVELVPSSALKGDAHNTFPVSGSRRFTHVRLSVFPDGGVARLRVHGQVLPDPRLVDGVTVDLASPRLGGAVVASSDDFYTSARQLIRPDRARSMGEGWETRRRRDAGHDFAVVRLGLHGLVRQVIVDTSCFRYNASAAVAVWGSAREEPPAGGDGWTPVLDRTRLQPDTRHVYVVPPADPVRWIRLDAFPDGGIARLRVLGTVGPEARRAAGYAWFNALPDQQATVCLVRAGLTPEAVARVTAQRPLPEGWAVDRRSEQGAAGAAGVDRADRAALRQLLDGPDAG